MYMPGKIAEQVSFSANFSQKISEPGFEVGLSPAQIAAFGTVNGTLQAAWSVADDPEQRTRVAVANLHTALRNMKAMVSDYVSIIQGNSTVTDGQKEALRITIRKTHQTPIPAPETEPFIQLVSVKGRVVTIELRQEQNKRGRPKMVTGASIFTATGETAPFSYEGWQYNHQTSKTTTKIDFGPSETGGTVWISAFWFNAKSQTGPASLPISVSLPAGGSLPAEMEEKETKRKAA